MPLTNTATCGPTAVVPPVPSTLSIIPSAMSCQDPSAMSCQDPSENARELPKYYKIMLRGAFLPFITMKRVNPGAAANRDKDITPVVTIERVSSGTARNDLNAAVDLQEFLQFNQLNEM